MNPLHLKRVTFSSPVTTDEGDQTTLHVPKEGHLCLVEKVPYNHMGLPQGSGELLVKYSRHEAHVETFKASLLASYSEDVGLNALHQHSRSLYYKYDCAHDFNLDVYEIMGETDEQKEKREAAEKRKEAMRRRVDRLNQLLEPHMKPLIDLEFVKKLMEIEPPEVGTTMWDHLLEDG